MSVSAAERRIVVVTVLAFFFLLVVWALVTPVFQAPDEDAHLDAVLHLALGHGWGAPGSMHFLRAVQEMARTAQATAPSDRSTVAAVVAAHPGFAGQLDPMSQHPPTWYAVLAVVAHLIGFEHHRWDVLVTVLRLVDAAVVAPLPLLVWASVRRLTGMRRLALIAPFGLVMVPELAQVSASVTVLAPTITLGGVLVWLAVRVLTGADRWVSVVTMGVTAGVMAWIDALGLAAAVFAVVVPLAVRAAPWARRLLGAAAAAVAAAAVGCWWWVHNLVVSGTLQPDGLGGTVRPADWGAGTTRDLGSFLDTQWNGLTLTFWGDLGRYSYPLSPILVDVLSVVAVVAVVWALARRFPERWNTSVLLVFPALVLLAVLVRNWDTYGRLHTIGSQQGRLVFLTLTALLAAQAAAWAGLVVDPVVRRRTGRWFLVSATVVGAYGFSLLYRGAYEGTNLGVTRLGLAHLRYIAPLGFPATALALLLLLVSGVLALVWCWRALAGPVPLDSPAADTAHPTRSSSLR